MNSRLPVFRYIPVSDLPVGCPFFFNARKKLFKGTDNRLFTAFKARIFIVDYYLRRIGEGGNIGKSLLSRELFCSVFCFYYITEWHIDLTGDVPGKQSVYHHCSRLGIENNSNSFCLVRSHKNNL